VASERYQAGLYDPEGAHLNPLKLALGLAAAIERAGGRIHEQSKALNYRKRAVGFGEHRTWFDGPMCWSWRATPIWISTRSWPVVCAGRHLSGRHRPLTPEKATSLLPTNVCVTDNQFVLDYFRRTPDNRLLFGGGCTYLGGMPKDIAGRRDHSSNACFHSSRVSIWHSPGADTST
jgi:glycine/D-amino acid oxidase-like deaminating enzyme